MIGQTISHYKIVEKLGEGGMGVVYKAEDLKLERFVALKFLAPHLVEDEEGRRRFQREAKAAAALDHPNVCTIHEIDEAEGRVFLAMAYLDGSTVRQKVKQRPLKLDEALDIAIQAGQGLQVAHEKGIVHRDIKSANLMVNARGQVKIMDFGLAQLAEQSKLTKTATILGTPAYMSPEQAVLYAIASEQPEPITALRVGIPTELDRIVGKALAKKPEERYQHIDEMLVDLRELQRQAELGARDTRRARPASKPVQRRGWYIAAAAVVITLTVAVSAWMGVFGPADEADEAAPEPLRAVQLTSYPGNESSPSFSPNGDQIAFRWDGENQENFDIYVKPIDSPSPLRLTTHPARDSSPAWSPDGRTIAFARELPGGKLAVLLIPAIGGPERKVAEIRRPIQPDVFNPHLAWAPGSEGLVVVDRSSPDEPFGLFLLSTESGQKRRLTSPPAKWMGEALLSLDERPTGSPKSTCYLYQKILALGKNPDSSPSRINPTGVPPGLPTAGRSSLRPISLQTCGGFQFLGLAGRNDCRRAPRGQPARPFPGEVTGWLTHSYPPTTTSGASRCLAQEAVQVPRRASFFRRVPISSPDTHLMANESPLCHFGRELRGSG